MHIINIGLTYLTTFVLILIRIAFFTLLERKVLGYRHLRKGPNKPSLSGLIVPIADAVKLFTKQIALPTTTNKIPFLGAPTLALFLALALWILYPFPTRSLNFNYGLILIIAVSSLNVYSVLLAGWTRNSKYSLIGALRRTAQTISYEVSIVIIILIPAVCIYSYNLKIYNMFAQTVIFTLPLFLLWVIRVLAETNRTPFDLSEGESELVSGFNTEYSSGTFALIFIAEYTNILVIALFTTVLFIFVNLKFQILTQMFLILTVTIWAVIFIWTRTSFPRIRYDQLIYVAWKVMLPIIIPALFLITLFMMVT